MKIIRTKEIKPIDIFENTNELFVDFQNRSKLHNGKIPAFYVYIQDYAWEAFLNHGHNIYKSLKHEAQGIFLGNYFKDNFGEFIVATKYAEGNGSSTHSYVEMSTECLSEISDKCKRENLLMLIWVHTHPGFGTFYSGTDINCLKTNFYKEYQIGLVVDILKNQILGYKTAESGVNEFHDYAIFNDKSDTLLLPFNGPYNQQKKKVEIISDKNNIENLICNLEKRIIDYQNKSTEGIGNINDYLLKIEHIVSELKIKFNLESDVFKNFENKLTSISDLKLLNKNQNDLLSPIHNHLEDIKEALKHINNQPYDYKGTFDFSTLIENIKLSISNIEAHFSDIILSNSIFHRRIRINNFLMLLIVALLTIMILLNGFSIFDK